MRSCMAGIKREGLREELECGPRAARSRILERELPAQIELARFRPNSLGLRSAPEQHLGNDEAYEDGSDCAGRGGRPPAWGTWTVLRKCGDWSDKPVPETRNGFDKARDFGVVSEGVSDLPDTGVQAMLEIDDGFGTPDGVPKCRSRHERAGPVDQQRQDSERLRCEPDDLTTAHQDMIDRIEIELPEVA